MNTLYLILIDNTYIDQVNNNNNNKSLIVKAIYRTRNDIDIIN